MSDDGLPDEVGHAVKGTIDKILNDVYEPISAELGVLSAKLSHRFFAYTKHSLERCLSIRTMDSPQVESQLNDFYVSSRFRWGSSEFNDASLVKDFFDGYRLILSGKGGSGKTIFLKYLFLQSFTGDQKKLPLLIELRRMNSRKSTSIEDLCRDSLNLVEGLPTSTFRKLCGRGFFTFIFDGFDEVSRSKRNDIEMELLNIARKYHRCGFIVSGRENTKFHTWEGFRSYKICDLNRKEASEIISKSNFELTLKDQITKDIKREGFFNKNGSLLATPLLVVMLLLTYKRTSRLPKILTNFYPQVFETLVYLHDSNKETFAREYSLDTDQFRRFFSLFSLISYLQERYEFSEEELSDLIKKTASYGARTDVLSGLDNIDVNGLKSDLWEASNLLIFDDGVYCFIHRSMQEYFAAEALSSIGRDKLEDVLRAFSVRTGDNAFKFAFELSESNVVDNFIMPEVRLRFQEIPLERLSNLEILSLLQVCFSVDIHPYESGFCSSEVLIGNQDLLRFLAALDLISGVKPGVQELFLRINDKVVGQNFRIPRNVEFAPGACLRFVFGSDGEVSFDEENSNSDEIPERALLEITRVTMGIVKSYSSDIERYIDLTRRKLLELDEASVYRNQSIDRILDL